MGLTVLQLLPALDGGGVERGTLDVGAELVRRGHRSLVMSAGGRMVAELEAAGSEHFAWPVGRKSLFTFRLVRPLRRFLVEQQVDILHLRSRLPAWIGYLAWKGLPPAQRPRLITTVHGPYTVGRYSAVMTRGERIIAVSAMIRDYVLANYPQVDAQRIRVIHRGVDTARFPHGFRPDAAWLQRWRTEHSGIDQRFVITLPARITRWKGQADFVELVGLLKARGIPVLGLIVGEAHPRRRKFLDELQALIASAGLADDIVFAGHRQDLREILAVSNVVLSLSREPEAFGRTTIEALSLGVPTAGYAHGGVAEQLQAVYPAGLLPVGDVAAAAELLTRWHRDGAPAVPDSHPFSLRRMLDETLALYGELAPEAVRR